MSQFNQAIALVHDALSHLRATPSGIGPRASLDALQQLVEASRASRPAGAHAPSSQSAEPTTNRRSAAFGLAARARELMEASSTASKPSTPASVPAPAPIPAPFVVAPPRAEGAGSKAEALERLRQRAESCLKCESMAACRANVVFGVGNPDAELMFVGEAPGAEEDLEGEPFVGKAGQLLTKIIEASGFKRSDVYITNAVKCRPDVPPGETGNRKPRPEEIATCLPFLVEQIEIIQPKCIVALGTTALEALLGKRVDLRDVRGHWNSFKGIPLMPTYHPAYLLHKQGIAEKRKVWEDMLQVLELLGKSITAKQRGYFLQK